MDNKEIFYKALAIAEKNGYVIPFGCPLYSYNDSYAGEIIVYRECIFSHDFAKSFWGVEYYLSHLMAMVVYEEPLKYLEKFLNV